MTELLLQLFVPILLINTSAKVWHKSLELFAQILVIFEEVTDFEPEEVGRRVDHFLFLFVLDELPEPGLFRLSERVAQLVEPLLYVMVDVLVGHRFRVRVLGRMEQMTAIDVQNAEETIDQFVINWPTYYSIQHFYCDIQ